MSLILIVEDNERNLKLLRDLLQSRGHTILEASTGMDGLRIAQASQPALVLMDIRLPDIDGISVFRTLRDNPKSAHIPVIAVSASVMPDEQTRAVASGFDDFIAKPINVKRFLAAVDRILPKGANSTQ